MYGIEYNKYGYRNGGQSHRHSQCWFHTFELASWMANDDDATNDENAALQHHSIYLFIAILGRYVCAFFFRILEPHNSSLINSGMHGFIAGRPVRVCAGRIAMMAFWVLHSAVHVLVHEITRTGCIKCEMIFPPDPSCEICTTKM